MREVLRSFLVAALLAVVTGLYGCAHTMSAIEHRELQTSVKMSDSIFLDVKNLAKNRTIFVKVSNTSDMQEIAFGELLLNSLRAKGMEVVTDPSQAGYILQANVLYMDYEKEGMTADGMLAGGYGGALAGAVLGGRGWKGPAAGAAAGAAVGSIVGGLIASQIKVETFVGTVDVQIEEKVEGGVKGKMTANVTQGTSTQMQTERAIQSDYQTYRTRLVAKATQTNIDKKEAARILSEKLATQISALF